MNRRRASAAPRRQVIEWMIRGYLDAHREQAMEWANSRKAKGVWRDYFSCEAIAARLDIDVGRVKRSRELKAWRRRLWAGDLAAIPREWRPLDLSAFGPEAA